jgi:hypothetical protein
MTAFIAIVPARLASTRLPRKPLVDHPGLPMVVRVAQRAQQSGAARVVVAADSEEIAAACRAHDVDVLLTSPDHPTGTDRLADAAVRWAGRRRDRRQRAGRRAADAAGHDRRGRRAPAGAARVRHRHRRARAARRGRVLQPERGQGRHRPPRTRAAVLARADPLVARRLRADRSALPASLPACATSACMRTAPASCAATRRCRAPRSRSTRASSSCARSGTGWGSPC